LLYGAGPVAHLLLQNGLIDELQVWLYPVITPVTENTKRLFDDAPDIHILRLEETITFSSGIVVHKYLLDRNA